MAEKEGPGCGAGPVPALPVGRGMLAGPPGIPRGWRRVGAVRPAGSAGAGQALERRFPAPRRSLPRRSGGKPSPEAPGAAALGWERPASSPPASRRPLPAPVRGHRARASRPQGGGRAGQGARGPRRGARGGEGAGALLTPLVMIALLPVHYLGGKSMN